jgi:hypothetical protein
VFSLHPFWFFTVISANIYQVILRVIQFFVWNYTPGEKLIGVKLTLSCAGKFHWNWMQAACHHLSKLLLL